LIFQLKHELANLQYGSMFVSSYYSKLRSIWESISELKPAHLCTCNGIRPWHDYAQMEYAIHFFMGLNESYSSIRGQILSMDPFPSINQNFSLVVQEEKQREIGTSVSALHSTNDASRSHAFAVKDSRYQFDHKVSATSRNRPLCAHCVRLGHTQDKCFKLHGFPPNYKKNKPSSSNTKSKTVNQVSTSTFVPDFHLTAQQYSQLMSLLQAHTSNVVTPDIGSSNTSMVLSASLTKFPQNSWIVDSGASTHIVCAIDLFDSYHYVSNQIVKLPNNAVVPVIAVGTVHLSPSLTLHNVSFIPNFTFNVLSVSALLTNSSYSVCFSSNQFVIQEMPHCKKIGRGDLLHGLYVLNLKDTHSTCNVFLS